MAKDKVAESVRMIGLTQVRDLFEQMAAGTDPITPEQLARFTRRPDGPLMPHGCVRSWYVPDRFGDNRGQLDENPVMDIVSQEGGGCHVLTSNGQDLCVYELDADSVFRLKSGREEPLLGHHARFLGLTREGVPVTMVSRRTMISDTDLVPAAQLDAEREGWLCIGMRSFAAPGVRACAWLAGDQFVFGRSEHDATREPFPLHFALRSLLTEAGVSEATTIFKEPITGGYKGFWLSPSDGIIAATTNVSAPLSSLTVLHRDQSLRLPYNAQCAGVVFMGQSVTSARLLVTSSRGRTSIYEWGENFCPMGELPQLHPCVEDDAKFTLLPDQRLAYVAKRRHQKRSWVVDGKLQAGSFDLVSNLFSAADESLRPGGPHYYGVAGRHIFLMKVV
jgi:hypothetical protein